MARYELPTGGDRFLPTWVILVLLALGATLVTAVGWRVLPLLSQRGEVIGDGKNVASYGFDLSNALVPVDGIVASGLSKDELPALNDPPNMPAEEVVLFNEEHRGKYLVSDDRVIGVVVNGHARAYPIRVLNWHEIVNDTLGGVPIAVTYHPLCDSVVVFDRRVAGNEADATETLTFGVSGLLLDSNLLMFDRRTDGTLESLWSQLRGRAVAGPAADADQHLTLLPVSVASWEDWSAAHPETTVLRPDVTRFELYRRAPFGNYYTAGKLRFPVDPLPPEDGLPWMTRVLIVRDASRQRVVPLDAGELQKGAGTAALLGATIQVAERDPATEGTDAPPSFVLQPAPEMHTIQSLWFAWYASHPESAAEALRTTVSRPDGEPAKAP